MRFEEGMTLLGEGYSIDDPQRKRITVKLPDSDRKGHFWCFGTTRSGKAEPLDARVLTPEGWRYMGDLRFGDKVITPNGESSVTGIFPQGVMDIYRITLEDGREVQATLDHLWFVRHENKADIFETKRLKPYNHFLPVCNENGGIEKFIAIRSIEKIRQDEARCISIDDEHGLYITNDNIVTHNTRLMESMIVQDIRKGYSVVVIDPKGDADLLANIVLTAAEMDRLEDLVYISPIYPEYSAIIDPLSHYYMPEELVAHIISGVETGKEPFFYNVAYEISLAVVLALLERQKYSKEKKGFNLLDIKNMISHSSLKELAQSIQYIAFSNERARQIYSDLQKILESPQDYYSKVSSSLRVALTELTSGNIGKIVGKADSNRFVSRLEQGKSVILIAQLGSLLTHKAAFTVGKVIISMIGSFVGRKFSSGKTVNPPMSIFIDEAQNVLYYGIDDLFAKAGGAGVWMHGFCQSVSQLYAEVGEDKAKSILDNTNTKIFMRVPDVDTSRYASDHFGRVRVYSPIVSASGGVTTREEERDTVPDDLFITLKPRIFYMISYGGRFKARTLNTSDIVTALPFKFKIVFPEIKATAKESLDNTVSPAPSSSGEASGGD